MRIVVAGTGTGVGKTTFSVALLRALRASRRRALGWKPVETGGDDDARALADAAGQSEPLPGIRLRHPLAPSVAARLEGREVELDALVRDAAALEGRTDILVIETAGGLFSPLRDDGATNAELAARLRPDRLVLVAANRLGVLHDVEACRRALETSGLRLDVVVLTGGSIDDAGVPSNAEEIVRRTPVVRMPTPELDEPAVATLLTAR